MITGLLVALAGGLGAATRFGVDGAIRARLPAGYPWGTTVINLSGSLLLGILTSVALGPLLPPTLQVVVGAGFLGGYTTFSTASVETVRLAQQRRWLAAVVNAVGMLISAVAAAAVGWWLGTLL